MTHNAPVPFPLQADLFSLVNTTHTSVFNTTYTPFINTTHTSGVNTTNGTFVNATFISNALEKFITAQINLYLPPVLFITGIISNVFVVLVMQSGHFRHRSTSFYISVSAIVDGLSLAVALPAHYFYVNFPHMFDSVRDAHGLCAFFMTFGWGTSGMGVLLTVAMTTERSLAIMFPLQANKLCTVRRAKCVTVVLSLLEVFEVGHYAFKSRVASENVSYSLCDVDLSDNSYAIFYSIYWPIINNTVLITSFVIIVIGNVIISIHVGRSGTATVGGALGQKTVANQGKATSKSRQLSIMLIIDSATIVICTLPFSIFLLLDRSLQIFDTSAQRCGRKDLVFAITFYLLYVNRCANFFLYCISGSRFRLVFKTIVFKGRRNKQANIKVQKTHSMTFDNPVFSLERGNNALC